MAINCVVNFEILDGDVANAINGHPSNEIMVERKNEGKNGGVEGEKEEKKEGSKGKLDRLKHSEGTRQNSVWRTEFIIFSLYVHRCTVNTVDLLFSYDILIHFYFICTYYYFSTYERMPRSQRKVTKINSNRR